MIVQHTGDRFGFGWLSTCLALMIFPCAVLGQQQQQAEGEPDDRDVAAAQEAQQEQPIWNAVRVIRVKGDRVAEFEGLLKQLGTAIAGVGQPGFDVWQVELGELNTYHIVAPFQSFADFMQMSSLPMEAAEWDEWLSRIAATIDSHQLTIAQIQTDLSILPEEPMEQPPELLLLMSQAVLPGKQQDYETWLGDEVLPALREADVPVVVANRMAFGAEDGRWVFAVPLQSWAELDRPPPLHRSMGTEAAEEMLSRGGAMVERSETILLRARPDLSAATAPTEVSVQ